MTLEFRPVEGGCGYYIYSGTINCGFLLKKEKWQALLYGLRTPQELREVAAFLEEKENDRTTTISTRASRRIV